MPAVELEYYHSLSAFADLFKTGLPILTYHKLGPRPAKARLKGLYVGEGLFARQMAELAGAGFKSATLNEGRETRPLPNQRVIITFDDGFANALEYGRGPLAESGFRGIQFLVAGWLGGQNEWEIAEGEAPEALMDEAQVRDWLAAGHEIGSHTVSHPWLTRLPVADAREEIAGSRKRLEDKFGVRIEHFCYPYGDWNEAVRDLVAEAGYVTACTTQAGVNTGADSPFQLKRLTARYPSRNFKAMWRRMRLG